jgi:flagellar motor switch protein FliG
MAEEAAKKLTGLERAAVLLMALGEQEAAEVMKHMTPKEVQSLGIAMATSVNVKRDQVEGILDEFVTTLENQTGLGIGTNEYVRSVLNRALGEDKAGGLIDRILLGANSQGLEALKWMDARAVAEIIRLEHPQIIAIVLSYLEGDHAADVLAALPERLQPDIMMRIASLDGIPPSALRELDAIMEKHFSSDNIKSASVGGAKKAADILNFVESAMENAIMEVVNEADAELGNKISELMFVFADLKRVDDRSVQALMRDITTDNLVLALKGADEDLKQKFLKNMSARAAEMLLEDLEAKGPVRLSEVEEAQREILNVAKQKESNGEISLSSGSDDFV